MAKRNFVCDDCRCEIDPEQFEDCDKAYIVDGKTLCAECFKEWLKDWMETSLQEVAEAVGVDVVFTEEDYEE